MILLDLNTFIGRLHPVLVHLPIGFLILTVGIEFWVSKTQQKQTQLIATAWFFTFVSAILSALVGWLLSRNGHYIDSELSLHQWMGIALVVFIGFAWIMSLPNFVVSSSIKNINNGILLVLLLVVGHLGGSLTHGSDFLLEYASKDFQAREPKTEKRSFNEQTPLDSIFVYKDLIQPILSEKCMACHNTSIQRGGLNMLSLEGLLKGGKSGSAIVGKNLEKSLIYDRITRSQKDKKFMPPTGTPLTYQEIQLVEWWIEKGAKTEPSLAELNPETRIQTLLLDQYALDTREKPWYETVQLEPLPKKYFTILEEANFSWRTLSSDNPLLDVRFHGSELDAKALLALEEVAPYITWLNLSDSNLQGTQTKVLAKMENLTHLQLQKNPIRVQDLTFLDSLKHLTILNLHSTLVNNTVLEKVKNLSHLEKLYLWNTRVNPTFIERNRARIPKTTVISGI